MGNQCHYMSKDDGPIVKVNLNDWATKRNAGFVFRTEAEFRDQETNATTPEVAGDAPPTMDNTKAEITAYLEANGFDVDQNDTKAEMLAALEA